MTDSEAAVHLNTSRSLAHQMRIPTDSLDFDDIVQEGAVAAWLATKDVARTDPVIYGMVVAKHRITGTLRSKHPMYGSEAEQGKRIHDLHRQFEKREIDAEDAVRALPYARDAYAEVERRVDMERALTGLEERDLIIAELVALSYQWAEIGEAVGMSIHGVRNRWRNILKPVLSARLRAVA